MIFIFVNRSIDAIVNRSNNFANIIKFQQEHIIAYKKKGYYVKFFIMSFVV